MPDPVAEPAIRVLYVDDDVALVRLVQKALGRRGFEVAHAANADEALAHIAAGGVRCHRARPLSVGHGTGLDFLARLAELEDAPAVVYVTGSPR